MRQSRNDKFQISEFQIVGTRHATSDEMNNNCGVWVTDNLKY